jgi:transglutaminase-like putative cysteine protease
MSYRYWMVIPLLLLPSVAIGQDAKKAKLGFPLIEVFPDSTESAERVNHFTIEQRVQINQISETAKSLKAWISVPTDEKNQSVVRFEVKSSPGPWTLVQDKERRGTFLFVDCSLSGATSIELVTQFSVVRKPEHVTVDEALVGPLTAGLKSLHADHLRKDAPHMTVTPEFQKIADEVCGEETNLGVQARLLLVHVASTVDHYSYSKDPKMPSCGIGDAAICKKQGGGCCTDLNSYFITLARARGIPARLNMGYRLQEKNRNKTVDSGYRCWVEYYLPGYGWISADLVEADTPGGLGHERWLTGLTSRRIWLNAGREFDFGDNLAVGKVNHMSIGYAEIDGVPIRLLPDGDLLPQLTRQVLYTESPGTEDEATSLLDKSTVKRN